MVGPGRVTEVGRRADGADFLSCDPCDALVVHHLGHEQHDVTVDRGHPLEQPAEMCRVTDQHRTVFELRGVQGACVDQPDLERWLARPLGEVDLCRGRSRSERAG